MELDLHNKPHLIYNCDETGVSLDPKFGKVVAPKCFTPYIVSSGNKEQVTVMAAVSATGETVNPLVLFKGKKHLVAYSESAPEGWAVKFTPSGWMNSDTFSAWIQEVFLPHINRVRRPGEKVLLLLDGHKSHESLEALEFARQNDIEIFCLPPNMTHLIQPLDVSVFKPLKEHWRQVARKHCQSAMNQFNAVSKAAFCRLFKASWDNMAVNRKWIINGFR